MKRAKKKKPLPLPRRTWKIHPATRVKKDKTKYDRKRAKRELLKWDE